MELTERKTKALVIDSGIILVIYMMLKPLYILPSGMPQISDVFLVLATCVYYVRRHGRLFLSKETYTWCCFFIITLFFQAIVNIVWFGITDDAEMLLKTVYYVFNFIVSMLCLSIGREIGSKNLKKALCIGCLLSITVASIGFVFSGRMSVRQTGFFNNPNQLGYYCICILTIIALFPDVLRKEQTIFILLVAMYGNILSLSKASIIGLFGMAICYTMWGGKKRSRATIVKQIVIIVIVFAFVYWFLYSNNQFIISNKVLRTLRNRILKMSSENDTQLGMGRGYDRIFELKKNILWGMGEGAFKRFKILPGYEVHSTYANLIVSYGLIGFVMYVWLFAKTVIKKGSTIRNLACLSGLLLYFITHNGIRNTLVWLILAVLFNEGKNNNS